MRRPNYNRMMMSVQFKNFLGFRVAKIKCLRHSEALWLKKPTYAGKLEFICTFGNFRNFNYLCHDARRLRRANMWTKTDDGQDISIRRIFYLNICKYPKILLLSHVKHLQKTSLHVFSLCSAVCRNKTCKVVAKSREGGRECNSWAWGDKPMVTRRGRYFGVNLKLQKPVMVVQWLSRLSLAWTIMVRAPSGKNKSFYDFVWWQKNLTLTWL